MDQIQAFARRRNLYVIEDNAEAFGGVYKGRKTGTLSHLAGCSFCQNKTFTTGGEGDGDDGRRGPGLEGAQFPRSLATM